MSPRKDDRLNIERKNLVLRFFLRFLEEFPGVPLNVVAVFTAIQVCERCDIFCNYDPGTIEEFIISWIEKANSPESSREYVQRTPGSKRKDSPFLDSAMEEVEKYLEAGGRFSENPKHLASNVVRKIGEKKFSHGLLVVASSRVIEKRGR